MAGPLTRFRRGETGAAAVLAALCLPLLVGAVGFAVDLGHVYMRTRQLQGAADLAAMAAVEAMSAPGVVSPAAAAQASAQSTAALNPWPGASPSAQAVVGAYDTEPNVPASGRFTPGAADPNAVRVTLSAGVPLYFAGLITGRSRLQISRSATAAQAQLAAFSIGSSLASLDGGVANTVLSAMTGSTVKLSVMDYQVLASAQVKLFDYLPALQTRAGLQAVGFTQALSTSTSPQLQLNALADALASEGQTQAAAAARTLAAASAALPADAPASLFDLGPYGAQDRATTGAGAGASVSALNLASALIGLSDGTRQLSLDFGRAVPGIASLKGWLAIGQRPTTSPWLTLTATGQPMIRTAQMRLYLQASVAPGALSGLTGGAALSLPVFMEAASASAQLSALQCPADPASQGFELSVTPSLGTLAIGQADPGALPDFTRPVSLSPAQLASAPILSATAFSQVQLGGAAAQTVQFNSVDIAGDVMHSVSADDVVSASVASLLASARIQVQVGGLGGGLGGGPTAALLAATLAPAAGGLDRLLSSVEALTGVQLGSAAVWPNGLRCNGAALVG